MIKKFPVSIFPDINEQSFQKYQKKNISEDFVAENFEYQGWNVYVPFVDTGIDLIATKEINGQVVTRFIQVKTRSLVNDVFGYTLSSKDFRDDPRHVFLFYSDSTNDFLILPMYEYLEFFTKNERLGYSHFAGKSFRVENNKLNSLRYDREKDEFKYNSKSFEHFRNEKGLELIETTYIEENFSNLISQIRDMKKDLFYTVHDRWLGTKVSKNDTEEIKSKKMQIEEEVRNQLKTLKTETHEERMSRFSTIEEDFKTNHPILYESHKRYIY